jgi:hypothetical protein
MFGSNELAWVARMSRVAVAWVVAVIVGASCAQPLPDLGADGSGSDDDPSAPTSSGAATIDDGTGSMDTTVDDTGIGPGCGNGLVEAGESCDDQGMSTTCDVDCTDVVCGDSIVNATAGEECEGEDLADGSCEGLGFEAGTLSCGGRCAYDTSGCYMLPAAPVLTLGFSQVKLFDFSWDAAMGVEHYQLLESASPGEPFVQLRDDIMGESVSLEMPLHLRLEASYVLRACNGGGCTDSMPVDVMSSLSEAVGYVKASTNDVDDVFGGSVALSGDGNTLAVGAPLEDSDATGISGIQTNDAANDSGAVYVLVRDGLGSWSQEAYIKASNTGTADRFGGSVALSGDGNTLAVGAYLEDSGAIGIGGNQADDSALYSGAVYVFVRDGIGAWSHQAYIKASNTDSPDYFGRSMALSGDGNTLAVGAPIESSNATGIGGNQVDDSFSGSGAVYVLVRDGVGAWSQQAYVKASNTGAGDQFGWSVALSGDGNTLAVGAVEEDSEATGIDGAQGGGSAGNSGAVYVFVRSGMGAWSQQAYVKASNTDANDQFGWSVALSGDGNTLAVGAHLEDGNTTGIGGDQDDDSATDSGAVYVFVRDGMGAWSQEAYVKASNTDADDVFGWSVALSEGGNILVVAAYLEDGSATGIGGTEDDDSASGSGAVYAFMRDDRGVWSQRAYVKASNTSAGDELGYSVALSGDGNTLAVGGDGEDSNATGISGDQTDDSVGNAGAVYLY